MLKQISPLVLIVAVSACSTPIDRRQVSDSDTYVNAATAPKLIIPAGLSTPSYSREFDIPKLMVKPDTAHVGKALDIRPPLQVLPMAAGTRVEEGSDNIKVIIESIDNDTDLKSEIYADLNAFLAQKNIAIKSEDAATGSVQTDWIENREVIESNLWGSDKVYLLRQRYGFEINVRPHGRTGSLTIDLIDHQENYNGEDKEIVLSGADKRRYTIDMLNSAISYISAKRNIAMQQKRLQESLGIDVALVASDDNAQAHWISDAKFKRTWDRLRLVLPEMGFDITDMDSNKGLLYVNVTDDSGFWSSLWSDKKLPMDEGAYRIELKDLAGDKTQINLLNDKNQPVDNETVLAVNEGFIQLMKETRKSR